MENREKRMSADEVKLKFVQRIMLMTFGCIAACALMGVLPLMLAFSSGPSAPVAMPGLVDGSDAVHDEIRMREISVDNQDSGVLGQFALLVPILIFLSLVFLLGYGAYDMYRLYLQYKRSRDVEDVMFP